MEQVQATTYLLIETEIKTSMPPDRQTLAGNNPEQQKRRTLAAALTSECSPPS